MERKRNLIMYFIYIFFIFGAIFHLIPFTKDYAIFFTPLLLLIVSYIAVSTSYKINRSNVFVLVFLSIFALIIEMVSVKTGLIFGEYSYGNILLPQIFGVPLIIGINWVVLTLSTYYLASNLVTNSYIALLLSSSFITIFDFILEPVAIKLDYWVWSNQEVPLQNYVAWFVISFITALVMIIFKIEKKDDNLIIHLIFAQVVFFGLLNVFLK